LLSPKTPQHSATHWPPLLPTGLFVTGELSFASPSLTFLTVIGSGSLPIRLRASDGYIPLNFGTAMWKTPPWNDPPRIPWSYKPETYWRAARTSVPFCSGLSSADVPHRRPGLQPVFSFPTRAVAPAPYCDKSVIRFSGCFSILIRTHSPIYLFSSSWYVFPTPAPP